MRKILLSFALIITSIAFAIGVHLATVEQPTDIQKHLNATVNTIAVAGTTTIFGLLDRDNSNAQHKERSRK